MAMKIIEDNNCVGTAVGIYIYLCHSTILINMLTSNTMQYPVSMGLDLTIIFSYIIAIKVVVVFAVVIVSNALTPNSYFTSNDVDRLRDVFAESRSHDLDLQMMHYSVLGYTLLGDALETPQVTFKMGIL